jgi:hypothetical protein
MADLWKRRFMNVGIHRQMDPLFKHDMSCLINDRL